MSKVQPLLSCKRGARRWHAHEKQLRSSPALLQAKTEYKIIMINDVVERRIKVTQQPELCLEIFLGCITSQQSDGFHLRGLISSALKLHNRNSAVVCC